MQNDEMPVLVSRGVAPTGRCRRAGIEKASGVVTLPLRVQWSGRRRQYDLSDRRLRVLAYDLVLSEGTDDDVRFFVDVDELVRLWDDLVLPAHVRRRSPSGRLRSDG